MRLEPQHAPIILDPERTGFLEAFASQIALGIERENLAQEARASLVRVEAERMRNLLLSTVSHDLRIPLTVIAGSASTLAESEKSLTEASRQELVQTILEESRRLDRLVSNLLEMSRLQSGEIKLNKEWLVFEEVVGTSLAQLEIQLRGRPVRVDVPADLPLVFMDALLIERVLTNLLENTVKYTPPGTAVEVSARMEGKEVRVEVADRGPGLPRGEEDRVFEKFYQATPGRKRGVGLGLSICRVIVHAHGGNIWARNRPGGGAAFGFDLPMPDEPPPLFSSSDDETTVHQ
jgi:two-component system sensor histidine kinase KdpD